MIRRLIEILVVIVAVVALVLAAVSLVMLRSTRHSLQDTRADLTVATTQVSRLQTQQEKAANAGDSTPEMENAITALQAAVQAIKKTDACDPSEVNSVYNQLIGQGEQTGDNTELDNFETVLSSICPNVQ